MPSNDTSKTYAQPVLAYRAWVYLEGNLFSIGQGAIRWRPGINLAYCNRSMHAAPAKDCHCGFNCFHTIEEARAYVERFSGRISGFVVIGAVAMRGQLEIHADGVRGEEAVILGLIGNKENKALTKVAASYDVPILDEVELIKLSQQVAAPVPIEDRPPGKRSSSRKENPTRVDKWMNGDGPWLLYLALVIAAQSLALIIVDAVFAITILTYIGMVLMTALAWACWSFLQWQTSYGPTLSNYIPMVGVSVPLIAMCIIGFGAMEDKYHQETARENAGKRSVFDIYQKKYQLQTTPTVGENMSNWNCVLGFDKKQPVKLCQSPYDKTVRIITEPHVR